ncbi:MAG: hypothetical protein CR994_05805 [Maribacter sp.]|nr:MAG: hypothetical protein CR994_05805 [Maribacter sp.]
MVRAVSFILDLFSVAKLLNNSGIEKGLLSICQKGNALFYGYSYKGTACYGVSSFVGNRQTKRLALSNTGLL